MKSLNKTLSLVLVLVMVFSLFGIASAAKLGDFTDKADVTYTEAVDYLTAAGVVAGDTATTINPKGEFTREQAAKLVAYACLGQVAADNLKATTAPFTDVATDRWSAGYIAYCAQQGIINGLGDGTFAPAEKVTGYQIGKMFLCAIGYGVNGEYTGSGWELAVAKDSLGYGIFESNTAGANNTVGATREEAFLYTFNVLSTLRNVSYNKTLGVYYVPGGSALQTNPKSANLIVTPYVPGNDTRTDTVGAIRFGMTRQITTDDYGYAAHEWVKSGVAVTGAYANDDIKVLGTVTDGTKVSEATTSNNKKYIASASSNGITFYYNTDAVPAFVSGTTYVVGDLVASGDVLYEITWPGAITTISTAAGLAGATLNNAAEYSVRGAEVALMSGSGVNAAKVETVSVIERSVVKLTAAPIVKTAGSTTTVTLGDIAGLTNITAKNVKGYADLAKDDVVLWYKNAASTKFYIERATSETGTVSGFVSDGTNAARISIGMTPHYISALPGANGGAVIANATATALVGAEGYTYYLDKGSNICYYTTPNATAVLSKTLFVYNRGASANLDGTYSTVAFFTDGNSKEIKTTTQPTIGDFYTYTTKTDGTYVLTATAHDTTYATDLTKGLSNTTLDSGDTSYTMTAKTAKFLSKVTATGTTWTGATAVAESVVANDATVFMIYDATNKSVSVYTGIKNAPSYTAGGTVYVLTDTTDTYAKLVVATGATDYAGTSNAKQVFVVSLGQIGQDTDKTTTYTYYAYVDGTYTPVVSYVPLSTGYLHLVKSFASNGYIKAATKVDASNADGSGCTYATGLTDVAFDSGVVTLTGGAAAGSYVVSADDIKVYYCDATDKGDITSSVISLAAAAQLTYSTTGLTDADVLTMMPVSSTDGSILTVYITIQ